MTTPAVRRPGWPQVAGEGVPADSPLSHARNGLAMLQLYREVSGIGMLPDPVRELLTAVERRLRLVVQGLELVEAGWAGDLEFVPGCACLRRKDGPVLQVCWKHA